MATREVAVCRERPGDEGAIDAAVTRAFGNADEANLVRMLRARQPGFDPALSICAWRGEELVGYLALIPVPLRLMGRRVPAAAVAPVAVIPACQRQGVGGRMLRFGHERARERGIEVAFLNGHPGYYPRHGYRACFGFSRTTYRVEAIPDPVQELEAWPVRPDDIPWLVACDEREWAEVDFTWPRAPVLSEWTIEGVNAVIWRAADGRRAAYTLTRAGQRRPGATLEAILGDDPELVRQVIRRQKPASSPHHPAGWLAREVLDPAWATSEATASGAAMAAELVVGALEPYLSAREA
ncbi:MAG: GNAT family N-acetyltransferase, partial [Gemmatimonadota bacterium]